MNNCYCQEAILLSIYTQRPEWLLQCNVTSTTYSEDKRNCILLRDRDNTGKHTGLLECLVALYVELILTSFVYSQFLQTKILQERPVYLRFLQNEQGNEIHFRMVEIDTRG